MNPRFLVVSAPVAALALGAGILACLAEAPDRADTAPSKAAAFDWPQWQGLNRTAISKETGLLKSWPKDGPPLAWKVKSLGVGFSTPSVAAGRIFAMGNRADKENVIALAEKDGKELWATPTGPAGERGGYKGPRCTPTVDGDRLYALGLAGDLVCLNVANGDQYWRRDLRKDFDGAPGGWGYTESPLIDGDKLIVTPGGKKATLVALNKKTGETIWTGPVPQGDGAAYASAIAADVQGQRQYIQFLSRGVVGVAAADGKFLWRYNKPANGTANCSTPIYHDDAVFAASGYGTGGGLAKFIKRDDGFVAEELYFTKDMKNQHGGMVFLDGHVYGSNEGLLVCLDFKTGKVVWDARQPGKGSIACADGHLYYRNEGGPIVLVEATPAKYVEKGRFQQPERSGQSAWPHPVIANGKLYVRDQELLLCYDVKQK